MFRKRQPVTDTLGEASQQLVAVQHSAVGVERLLSSSLKKAQGARDLKSEVSGELVTVQTRAEDLLSEERRLHDELNQAISVFDQCKAETLASDRSISEDRKVAELCRERIRRLNDKYVALTTAKRAACLPPRESARVSDCALTASMSVQEAHGEEAVGFQGKAVAPVDAKIAERASEQQNEAAFSGMKAGPLRGLATEAIGMAEEARKILEDRLASIAAKTEAIWSERADFEKEHATHVQQVESVKDQEQAYQSQCEAADAILQDVQTDIQRLQAERDVLRDKIKMVDTNIELVYGHHGIAVAGVKVHKQMHELLRGMAWQELDETKAVVLRTKETMRRAAEVYDHRQEDLVLLGAAHSKAIAAGKGAPIRSARRQRAPHEQPRPHSGGCLSCAVPSEPSSLARAAVPAVTSAMSYGHVRPTDSGGQMAAAQLNKGGADVVSINRALGPSVSCTPFGSAAIGGNHVPAARLQRAGEVAAAPVQKPCPSTGLVVGVSLRPGSRSGHVARTPRAELVGAGQRIAGAA